MIASGEAVAYAEPVCLIQLCFVCVYCKLVLKFNHSSTNQQIKNRNPRWWQDRVSSVWLLSPTSGSSITEKQSGRFIFPFPNIFLFFIFVFGVSTKIPSQNCRMQCCNTSTALLRRITQLLTRSSWRPCLGCMGGLALEPTVLVQSYLGIKRCQNAFL